ncbi:hypothetical protein KSS87_019291 [Heliosperma pusillum]|nr:hypothetical protein KSS87_019291 [Heliosperma pusillum]
MASVSEHSKQLQELNSSMPIDNIKSIDSLPDELLINIINFLPIKHAAMTSILSRRWICLFKEVTRLDFVDSCLSNSVKASYHPSCFMFGACICTVLDCLKLPNLISFRIKSSGSSEQCFKRSVNSWLDGILSHGIQEIDLCLDDYVVLPHSIFTCQTLCILKLTISCTLSAIPDTVCLPCLKIFHLDIFMVLHAHGINRIFSGCPSLQDFYMGSLGGYKSNRLSISAPSLRKLKLGTCKEDSYRMHPMAFVAVDAPLLQSFHYADKLAEQYSIKTSNYLVEAHLDTSGDFYDFVDLSPVSKAARDLVQGVSNVKRLFLSAYCIEALTLFKDKLPILRNLTKLKIGCSINPHFTLLRLLGSAPNLEELIFSEGLFHVTSKEKDTVQHDYWGRGRAVPSCLKTHLKVIEIEHFLGLKEELRIADFFLRNSRVLEQLIIQKWVGSKDKFKSRKQLKRLSKRWKKCVNFNELFL